MSTHNQGQTETESEVPAQEEIPSFSRHWRKVHTNKLQFHRWILPQLVGLNFSFLVAHFSCAYLFNRSPVIIRYDGLSIILSVSARLIWNSMFLDQSRFLGVDRASEKRKYGLLVFGVVLGTTVPNALVQGYVLNKSWEGESTFNPGGWFALVMVCTWLVASAFCVRMWFRYLIDRDGGDVLFEPCGTLLDESRNEIVPISAPYSDALEYGESAGREEEKGELEEAYSLQQRARFPAHASPTSPERSAIDNHQPEENQPTPGISNAGNASSPPLQHPLRCPTIAKFEYMPENQVGYHALLFFPLIPAAFFIYSSYLFVVICIWLYENSQFRISSPKIRGSLYLPLGLYLICFYALKHRLRRSHFEKGSTTLPNPWMEALPIFKRFRAPRFRRSFADPPTIEDPRRRQFPPHATDDPRVLKSKAYIEAYNAHPTSCDAYWGHQGRQWKTMFRMRPLVLHLGYLGLAMLLTFKGGYSVFTYPQKQILEQLLGYADVDAEDLARWHKMASIMGLLMWSILLGFVPTLLYPLFSLTSMTVLFGKEVLRYVEMEKRGEVEIG